MFFPNRNKFEKKEYMEKFLLPEPVYYVECSDDDTVLVGMDVCITKYTTGSEQHTWVEWFDTCGDRCMEASQYRMDGSCFTFVRKDSMTGKSIYRFIPMDLDIFHEKCRKRMFGGKDHYDTKEEMINDILLSKENAD